MMVMNLSLRFQATKDAGIQENDISKPDARHANRLSVKDIVMIGMMTACLITIQVSLSFLPNIELVTLLIIIFTLVFGWRTIFVVFAFTFVEGLIYGFGFWWFSYLYIWPLLFAFTMLFRKFRSIFFWAVASCLFGLAFGALTAFPTMVISGLRASIAYWIQGIPFDLVHGISNLFLTLILFYPLYFVMSKIHRQFYGNDPKLLS